MHTASDGKVWLCIHDVASILSLSRKTVLRMVKLGKLRARDVSTGSSGKPCWRIHRAWLDDFAQEKPTGLEE